MKSKNLLVSLVAVFALAMLSIASVSASGVIQSVQINDIELFGAGQGGNVVAFAGDTISVEVQFFATGDAKDVVMDLWISGEKKDTVSSVPFNVVAGNVYKKTFAVPVPLDLKDRVENRTLIVRIDSNNGPEAEESIRVPLQRESYIVEILDVNMPSKVNAGSNVAVDVVLKNRGFEDAEDTFVKVSIPALGVEQKAYFADLAPVDDTSGDNDDHDSAVGRLFLEIPEDAKAGVYAVQIDSYNSDSATTLSKKLAIVGATDESRVISSASAKDLAVGEKGSYSLTIVNAGNKVKIYDLTAEASEDISVDLEDSVIVVPAGSSKTVKVDATPATAGKHVFTVSVLSEDGDLVKAQSFTANVEGTTKRSTGASGTNTTVLLTVILAIVFVVLLVVLIVLLTRKPEKPKEFGESYY
jgi:hypothetical protein